MLHLRTEVRNVRLPVGLGKGGAQDQPSTNWRAFLWDTMLHLRTEGRRVRPPAGFGKGGGEWGEERWAGGQGGCAASWEADLNHWSTIARLLARFCKLFGDHNAGPTRHQLECLPLERRASPLYRGTPRPSASGVG